MGDVRCRRREKGAEEDERQPGSRQRDGEQRGVGQSRASGRRGGTPTHEPHEEGRRDQHQQCGETPEREQDRARIHERRQRVATGSGRVEFGAQVRRGEAVYDCSDEGYGRTSNEEGLRSADGDLGDEARGKTVPERVEGNGCDAKYASQPQPRPPNGGKTQLVPLGIRDVRSRRSPAEATNAASAAT